MWRQLQATAPAGDHHGHGHGRGHALRHARWHPKRQPEIPRSQLVTLSTKTAQDIHPGVFFTQFPNEVLRVQAVDLDGTWRNVVVADTKQPGRPVLQLAARGGFVLDQVARTVTINLFDVRRYSPGAELGLYDVGTYGQLSFSVSPESFFATADANLARGTNEMTIAQLREEIENKRKAGIPQHVEIMSLQQKFSFPVACLVLALLGLGLGVHTRREGKLASFATGIAVIFVYYMLMYLAQNITKGLAGRPDVWSQDVVNTAATWARWVPNLVLGPIGVFLVWSRSRGGEGMTISLPAWLVRRAASSSPDGTTIRRPRGQRVVLVLRFPHLPIPRPRLLDLYVSFRYLRMVALSCIGLLGLFYISTLVDLSEKLFKGQASTALLLSFFWYKTPQFLYFLIPIATLVAVLVTIGALTKTSELTVIRACGVSLYRVALPLVGFAVIWSALLFALDEGFLAQSNRRADQLEDTIRGRPPRLQLDASSRSWLTGGDDRLYYYTHFDARRRTLNDVSVFEWSPSPFRLLRHTYAQTATYRDGAEWLPQSAWMQTFSDRGAAPRRQDLPNAKPLLLEPISSFGGELRDIDVMSFNDLRGEVEILRSGGFSFGQYAVAMYGKLAFPFVTIVMTLLAVPFAVTTGRRGTLYGIGLAITLSFVYRMAMVVFAALGASEMLPPALAASAPDLLFLAGATYLLLTVRT